MKVYTLIADDLIGDPEVTVFTDGEEAVCKAIEVATDWNHTMENCVCVEGDVIFRSKYGDEVIIVQRHEI